VANLTIKGLTREVHERLRRRARERGRSLNREVILILEKAVWRRTPDPEEIIARIDAIHRRGKMVPVTEEFLRKVKREGLL